MTHESMATGQLPGIVVVALRCDTDGNDTVDCSTFCRCDDGSDYAIKDASKRAAIPHQEWFCTRLGEIVGLASPPCRIVKVGDDFCFGSRLESGMESGFAGSDWWIRAKKGDIDFSLLAPSISRIFAYDLFVHNVDRHLNNYIIRKQRLGHAALAYDYSQAWLFSGFPPPSLPLAPDCMTIKALRYLRREFGDFINIEEVFKVLDNLERVKVDAVNNIISEHPDFWLTNRERNDILVWWGSAARAGRIAQIKEGAANGSYL